MRAAAATALVLFVAGCATTGPPRPIPDTHTLVPGSRVSMVVPAELRADPALPGFESADGRTAIFVNEVPGSVYSTMRSFTGEGFQKNGMHLDRHERVSVDGWPARLYHARQPLPDAELARWVLVFGDSSQTVLLTAVSPQPVDPERSDALRAALLSARWHKDGLPERTAAP